MFITFEGGEGSGKTTQIRLLKEHFESKGETVVTTREPGGTKLAESIRGLLLDPSSEICDQAECYLFASARAQHIRDVIRPALHRGDYVLCDRFVDSSLAYQGVGRGLGFDTVLQANDLAIGDTWPDLTLLLDLPVAEGLRRAGKRATLDRIEREHLVFHKKVQEGFRECWKRWPDRVALIRAENSVEEVHAEIKRELLRARC